jgi:hypothetical protein
VDFVTFNRDSALANPCGVDEERQARPSIDSGHLAAP